MVIEFKILELEIKKCYLNFQETYLLYNYYFNNKKFFNHNLLLKNIWWKMKLFTELKIQVLIFLKEKNCIRLDA